MHAKFQLPDGGACDPYGTGAPPPPPPVQGMHNIDPYGHGANLMAPGLLPIGPPPMRGHQQRPAASLLPDQEFIPINTDSSTQIDRMQVFGDSPFTSSLFSSGFSMFGPVAGHSSPTPAGVAAPGPGKAGSPAHSVGALIGAHGLPGDAHAAGFSGSLGLLADLHADSRPVAHASGRHGGQ